MKKLTTISSILLSLIILTASISIISLNKSLYPKVKDYNTEETLALDNVVNYLNNQGKLSSEFFNSREISHMKDVKQIFDIIKIILVLSIILLPLTIGRFEKNEKNEKIITRNKELIKTLKYGSIISFSFILILALSFIKFDLFFNIFHQIFFKEGTWLFYSTDMLIRLFPFNFFLQSCIRIIITIFILITTIWITKIIKNK